MTKSLPGTVAGDNVNYPIGFGLEILNSVGTSMHTTTTGSNHIVTIPMDGIYSLRISVEVDNASTSGLRQVAVNVNGDYVSVADENAVATSTTKLETKPDWPLHSGDTLMFTVLQNSGTTLTISANSYSPIASVIWLCPLP